MLSLLPEVRLCGRAHGNRAYKYQTASYMHDFSRTVRNGFFAAPRTFAYDETSQHQMFSPYNLVIASERSERGNL